MTSSIPRIIQGAATVASQTMEAVQQMFSLLEKHHIKDLDTAYSYICTQSEETLSNAAAPVRFIIHSKAPAFRRGDISKENVLSVIDETLERLGVKFNSVPSQKLAPTESGISQMTPQIETLFLHVPDPITPIEETLPASPIDEIHRAGKFKHMKIYDIQASKNSVLPTVFQCNYNAVSRTIDLKVAFYAYSPIAGFVVKSPEALRAGTETGRFDTNSAFGPMCIDLRLSGWGDISAAAGISKTALAYRWITFHSALTAANGDGKTAQVEETLEALEVGPLEEEVVAKIEGIWKMEKEAPLDNYHSYK
ncbi:NADP-dependent oxidoreductase domain-containing protein [Lipomyces doorenjongii]